MTKSANKVTRVAARQTSSGYLIDIHLDGLIKTFSTKKELDNIAVDLDGAVYGYKGEVEIPFDCSWWKSTQIGGVIPLGTLGVKVNNWSSTLIGIGDALELGRADTNEVKSYAADITIISYSDTLIMTAVERMPLGAEIVAVEHDGELLPFRFKPNRIEVHDDLITFLHTQSAAGFMAEVSFKRGTRLQVAV